MLKLSTRWLGLTWPNQLLKGLAFKSACLHCHHLNRRNSGRWSSIWSRTVWSRSYTFLSAADGRPSTLRLEQKMASDHMGCPQGHHHGHHLDASGSSSGSSSCSSLGTAWLTQNGHLVLEVGQHQVRNIVNLHHDHGHRRLHRSSSTTNFAWTRQQQGSWWHRLAQLAHRWRWWWWYYCWWWYSQQTCTTHFPQFETLRMLVDISFLRSNLASPSVAPTGKPGSSMDSPVRKFVAIRWLKSKIWFIPSSKFQWRQYKCK